MSYILFGFGADYKAFDTPMGEGDVSSCKSGLVALNSMGEAAFLYLLRVLPDIIALIRGFLISRVDVFFFG